MAVTSTLLFFALLPTPPGDVTPAEPSPAAQTRPSGPTSLRAPRLCDDGSAPWDPAGAPNWDCEIDACSPHELICWDERLDFCFDDSGNDAGICLWRAQQSCSSVWQCFKLWANCDGRYECQVTGSPFGCAEGTCDPVPRLKKQGRLRAPVAECPLEDFEEAPDDLLVNERDTPTSAARLWLGGQGDNVGGRDA